MLKWGDRLAGHLRHPLYIAIRMSLFSDGADGPVLVSYYVFVRVQGNVLQTSSVSNGSYDTVQTLSLVTDGNSTLHW
jgi:hypothetical protein